jgi:hypothetical protein
MRLVRDWGRVLNKMPQFGRGATLAGRAESRNFLPTRFCGRLLADLDLAFFLRVCNPWWVLVHSGYIGAFVNRLRPNSNRNALDQHPDLINGEVGDEYYTKVNK